MRFDLRALLAKPAALWVSLVLGVALCAPALGNNLQGEDYAMRTTAQAAPWTAQLYASGPANPQAVYQLIDRGGLPWITNPRLHISFFRPLGSLSLHVDYRFWPERPVLMFAHSLLWLALLLAASLWLYRRVVRPEWAAGLAALLSAFDDVHGAAVAWLAARHTLVASALGVLAIALHDRWRRSGFKAGAFLAPLALLLALFAGEIGTGAVAFLFAHALFLDPAPARARWRAVAGWLAVVAVWGVLYVRSGAGTYGSGLYLHPLDEPIAFAAAAVERFAFLFIGVFWAPSADFWTFLPAAERARWTPLLWVVVVAILALLVPVVRRDRALCFWLCGTLLSMLALCSAPATDRSLIFPALGSMALMATVIAKIADRDSALPSSRLWRWPALGMSLGFCLINLVLSPLTLPVRATVLRTINAWLASSGDELRADQGQHLIVVNATDYYTGTISVVMGTLRHPPGAACNRILYGGLGQIQLSRPDPYTLIIDAPGGFLENEFNRVYRGIGFPLRVGDGLQLTKLLIRVEQVENGDAKRVRFQFAEPLEHPAFRWFSLHNGRFVPFVLPRVGETRTIPALVAPTAG